MGKCLGHFALSQYLADDLRAEERREVSAHLEGCETCRGLLDQIEQDRAAYAELGQEHYNVAWRAAVAGSSEPRPARRPLVPLVWKVLLPVAAAAVAVAVIVPRLVTPPPPAVQYKGSLSLQIIAKREERPLQSGGAGGGSRQFVVSDNHQLCPGDALRFSVTAEGEKNHLVIFSVDRANTLSAFYPNSTTPRRLLGRSGKTIELTGQGRHVLPGSIILDQSQGREVIFMLAAPRPFDPGPLKARIKKLSEKNPRAAEALTGEKIGFSGAVRAVPVVKAPCS
jgi:hypothetical protein